MAGNSQKIEDEDEFEDEDDCRIKEGNQKYGVLSSAVISSDRMATGLCLRGAQDRAKAGAFAYIGFAPEALLTLILRQ